MAGINVIYGAGSAGSWGNEVEGPQVLDVLEELGVSKIDTARIYGPSEQLLGERGAAARIALDTKHPGGFARETRATKENILEVAKTSFELLKTDQVDVYYIHAPDRKAPLEETLEGINELYKQGCFKRFGLSNYLPSEVEQVVQVAKEKGFVVPTVYQGNYSLIARKQETELFPVLRRHGIAFNAYSPLAGGFLTKTAADLAGDGGGAVGRFKAGTPVGQLYLTLYHKPSFLAALTAWDAISAESGIAKAELAYRWVAHHSALKPEYGDGMIIGSRNLEQLRTTLLGIKKGPLSEKVVSQIDGIWDLVKGDAGLDNFNLNDA